MLFPRFSSRKFCDLIERLSLCSESFVWLEELLGAELKFMDLGFEVEYKIARVTGRTT
jgi:hypothetical protein